MPGNSKEHYWGKWTRKYLPPLSKHNDHELRRPVLLAPGTFGERVAKGPMTRQGGPRQQQIKGACQTCNNGWMKRLHQRAEPHLVRLAKGDWWHLDDTEKTAVASYFAIVSMMWQLADRETMASNHAERTHLMKNMTPPDNWWVFVAEHQQTGWNEKLMYTGFGAYEVSDPAHLMKIPKQPNCHSLISTFGKVAFNTLSVGDSASEDFKRSLPEYAFRLGLQTIWPLNGAVIRKPARPHTDAELTNIGNFFYLR
jgi:hypothetical protein